MSREKALFLIRRSLQESNRLMKKIKERDDAELARLRNRISQMQEGADRAMSEWKDRCISAERKEKMASDHLIEREKVSEHARLPSDEQ